MSTEGPLKAALEHPANDLRDLLTELYPDATIRRGRTRAVWRGGDGESVVVGARTMRDFVTGETYGAWRLLTELAGFSKAQAAEYLLGRAGLASNAHSTPRAKREATAKSERRAEAEARQEARRAAALAAAHELQRTAPLAGVSAYLEGKGVAALFETHTVASGVLPSGEAVPGLVYSEDGHGAFMQLALRTLDGTVTGYQRLYDGDRGKRFVLGTKPTSAFVLLEPKGKPLPGSGTALAALLAAGYEVAICEGLATGASIALARPKAFVLCALSAGNLAPVAEALRSTYGYTRKLDGNRKAVDLTIWGDFDESGTGQEKAHAAALTLSCYVRLPKFKHGYGDFNDLHAARGLEAVKRTRRVTPDVRLAFAKELSKQKLSEHKHLHPFELPDPGAALIVRAPQESGKTHRLAELLAGSGLRALVVTHRESLAKALAARLRFDCYQDLAAYHLRDARQLVICFDSLQKLTIGGALPSYELLVLDESEQVLEHTSGRHIKRKRQNFEVLEALLRDTPRIICADADAGALTADTLRRYGPARQVRWHIHEHHIAAGRRLRLTHERDDVLDALEGETRPTWYASDSLRHTRDLSAYLDDPDALTINSETATTEDASAYLLDPSGRAPKHRRLIASPSVQTGLSDDSGHWQHVMGAFSGYASTPQDALQALMRARRVPELTVYATKGRGAPLTVQEALEGAAAADDFEAAALSGQTHGATNPNYERLRAEVAARRAGRQLNYRERLALKAAQLGYSVTYDLPQDLNADELDARQERAHALKEAGLGRYVRDRVSAERIDEARAKALDDAYTLSQADRFALEQYQLRAFYALPDDVEDDALAEMLRLDEYGALRRKVERYEGFIEPRAVAEARARGELEGGVLRGDSRTHMLRHEYGRRLGAVIGLDAVSEAEAERWQEERERLERELRALKGEAAAAQTRRKGDLERQVEVLERELGKHEARTLSTAYNAHSESVRAFIAWCVKHYPALRAAGLVTCTRDNLKAKPLEAIGDSLRRCGLEHRREGERESKRYALMLEGVSTMANYSRPRRINWDSAQQNAKQILDNRLLCKSAVLASRTGLITDAVTPNADTPLQKPLAAPPPTAAGAAAWLSGLLDAGKLDAFGPRKLALIRQKVAEQDAGWLHTLARSRDTGRALGAI